MSRSAPSLPPVNTLPRASASTHLHGAWLLTWRGAWGLVVLIDLGVLIVGLPGYASQLHTPCTDSTRATCNWGQLTPPHMLALQHFGWSLDGYVVYALALCLAASLVSIVVGALIFRRTSAERMGLFVSLLLLTDGMLGPNTAYLTAIYLRSHHASPLILLPGLIYLLQRPALGILFCTFPDGRFVPRWSWLLAIPYALEGVLTLLPAPYGLSFWPHLLQLLEWVVVYGSVLTAQAYRYVRVASPSQRQQIKWLVFVAVTSFLLTNTINQLPFVIPALNSPNSFYPLFIPILVTLPTLPVPLGIGVALLRYRLWDIDTIINRALVYGVLTAGIVSLYVLVVSGLGTLLQAEGNFVLSLLATGLIAVFFSPLRTLLQRAANRLMYGDRDDPYGVIAHLGQRLEGTLAPEKVLPAIVETIAQTLKLPYVAIALLPEQQETAPNTAKAPVALAALEVQQAMIVAATGAPLPDLLSVSLVHQAETIGSLLLAPRMGDTFGKADTRLLTELARQAGAAVYAVRVTTHLQQVTESLHQAREHLVTTREEERRRLRRDLHDGLGPALASLIFKVDAARNLLARDSARVEALLAEVRQQAQEAIRDIRRLVYDLRPPALDEFGLLSALREQAAAHRQGELEVEVEMPVSLPPLSAAVEVAVYRIAQEALTNVTRHAQAQHCLLRLSVDQEALLLIVKDDGQGIPVGHRVGVGLHAMHERASELGGACAITSSEASGTMIQVRFLLPKTERAYPPSSRLPKEHGQGSAPNPEDLRVMGQKE